MVLSAGGQRNVHLALGVIAKHITILFVSRSRIKQSSFLLCYCPPSFLGRGDGDERLGGLWVVGSESSRGLWGLVCRKALSERSESKGRLVVGSWSTKHIFTK